MSLNLKVLGGYGFYNLYKLLPSGNISYDYLLDNLDDSNFLIASEPVVKEQNGADLEAIHERLLSISHNTSNEPDIILHANSLLVSFGDNKALQYMYDLYPGGYSMLYHYWPSFDYCDSSHLELIKRFYEKTIRSKDFFLKDDIEKALLRLSLVSVEACDDMMLFFDDLANKYPEKFWRIAHFAG